MVIVSFCHIGCFPLPSKTSFRVSHFHKKTSGTKCRSIACFFFDSFFFASKKKELHLTKGLLSCLDSYIKRLLYLQYLILYH